jgi:endonuclease YncB( thermonuclease family)
MAERSRPHGRAEHSLTIQKPVSDRDLPRTLDRALGAHGLTQSCVPCTHGEEIPTMPPFGMPTVAFKRESCPDVGQVGCDHGFGGISLIPLAWPQLVSWIAGEAPEISNRRRIPPGMIATAEAVMILPTPGGGGNTIIFIMANQAWLRVRPFGIDLPEPSRRDPRGRLTAPGQPYGDAAAACLAGLVLGRHVRLEIYGIDRARRVLGTLFSESDNLNLTLVEAGLAEVYGGSSIIDPYQPQYVVAEAAARHAGRGMWALGSHYESPRAYRRRVRLRPARRAG